jgi:hypothetical protein
VRGRLRSCRPNRSTVQVARKPIASRSERLTVPAMFQCTFSKVTQKIVARKK